MSHEESVGIHETSMRQDRDLRAEMKYMRRLDAWLCDMHGERSAMRQT